MNNLILINRISEPNITDKGIILYLNSRCSEHGNYQIIMRRLNDKTSNEKLIRGLYLTGELFGLSDNNYILGKVNFGDGIYVSKDNVIKQGFDVCPKYLFLHCKDNPDGNVELTSVRMSNEGYLIDNNLYDRDEKIFRLPMNIINYQKYKKTISTMLNKVLLETWHKEIPSFNLSKGLLSKIFCGDKKKIKEHRLTNEMVKEFDKRLEMYYKNEDIGKLEKLYHEMKRVYNTVAIAIYGRGSNDYTFTEYWNLGLLECSINKCEKYIDRLDY